MTQRITFTIDGRLPSRANQRQNRWERAAQNKSQRTAAKVETRKAIGPGKPLYHWYPIVVTMIRVSPRLLDDDNLAAAFKSVRDGIADALGIDDRDPRITWKCEQAKGKPPRCEIAIERET